MVDTTAPKAQLRSNILQNYVNYTYNIEIWALSKLSINKIAANEITVGKEDNLLQGAELIISDAGQSGSKRSQDFDVDFGIDNVVISSLVGNRGAARGVDTVELKFDIIEPYTVTFLDRLIRLSSRIGFGPDFKTLTYCMKIQFFGYNDDGTVTKINTTKWIPFSLISMKFSVTKKGAVYNCSAIPCQNFILSSHLDNIVPFHVELKGYTVGDLFNGVVAEKSTGNNARTDAPTLPNNSNTVVTKGIAIALNDNEVYKRDQYKTQKFANLYKFEFDDEILNSPILTTAQIKDISRPYTDIKGAAGAATVQSGKVGSLTLDTTTQNFRAQAGTKITELINSILSVSDYMRKQITDQANKAAPTNLWKITPKLKIINIDRATNFFAREVTFAVEKYAHFGQDYSNSGQKPPGPESLVKSYDYIFTGNNRDVINADVNFEMAFFEPKNGTKGALINDAGDGTGQKLNDPAADPNDVSLNTWLRSITPQVNGLADQHTTATSTRDLQSIGVGELMSKLFDNAGDMISLDLTIVGDPDWIQQDRSLYGSNVPAGAKTLSNGTITYNDSGTYFSFNFLSPTKDYDPTTGIFDVSNTSSASFSGIYQVITVTSTFSRGKFTQKLDNFRVRIQKASESNTAGTSPTTDSAALPAPQ